ncbi:MAG: hypothetical protein AAGJ46_13555 [Planctomycetota bacterium]
MKCPPVDPRRHGRRCVLWGARVGLLAATPLLILSPAAHGAPAANTIFPPTTVAFFSVADAPSLKTKWRQTQVGQFTSDEALRPFVTQMRGNIIDRFGNIEERLGMTFDDLTAAAAGEVGVGMLHPTGDRACVGVVLDVAGKDAEAESLINKAEQQLATRGATRKRIDLGGVSATVLSLPPNEKREYQRDVVHFRSGDLLIAVDNVKSARQMAGLLAGRGESLAGTATYTETMRRCQAEARGLKPDIDWFCDPFAWDSARRTLYRGRLLPDRKDNLTIFREQGFDAIKGIGGHIALAVTAEQDIIHRTAIYAPPLRGDKRSPAAEKYRLGMRMAELPNTASMPVEKWAPRMTATYTTLSLDILNAYDHVSTLFDAISGYEGSFKRTIDSFYEDPYGPEIQVRQDLVQHLGKRVTIMTDYKLPIDVDCERYAFVVDVTNPTALRGPLDRLMETDGIRREINGQPFWELLPEDEMPGGDVDDGLLESEPIDDIGAEEGDYGGGNERLLRRAAVCLKGEQLIVASDVEFLADVLFGVDPRESLAGSYDFQAAMRSLGELAPWERCSYSFFRTDESIRPSYELIRKGLMPQSQTFFGRLLNEMLTTEEDEQQGIVRKQRIDGSALPSFEVARRYFGPATRAIRTDGDGWFITGVVLSKAGQ